MNIYLRCGKQNLKYHLKQISSTLYHKFCLYRSYKYNGDNLIKHFIVQNYFVNKYMVNMCGSNSEIAYLKGYKATE